MPRRHFTIKGRLCFRALRLGDLATLRFAFPAPGIPEKEREYGRRFRA